MSPTGWLLAVTALVALGVVIAIVVSSGGTVPLAERVEVVLYPNCSKKVLELILTAEYEIYLSSHQSSGREVARALVEAHRRGVRVTVVLDERKYNGNVRRFRGRLVSIHDPLKKVGATAHLFDFPGRPYMHSKIILVDGTLVVGSMNVEDRDLQRDNYLVFEDAVLYERYKELFEQHYLNDRSYSENFEYDGPKKDTIEAYFGPAPDFAAPLIRLIEGAERSIEICVVDLSHPPVVAALQEALSRGVEVTIAFSAVFPWVDMKMIESGLELKGAGARVVWVRGGVHHKFMVVDERITLTGSPGFVPAPLTENFETYLIVYSEEIARKLLAEIDLVLGLPKAEVLTVKHLREVRKRLSKSPR